MIQNFIILYMKTIGLDLSINSTGICINTNGKYKYYIICSKMTKKMKEFDNKPKTIDDIGKDTFISLPFYKRNKEHEVIYINPSLYEEIFEKEYDYKTAIKDIKENKKNELVDKVMQIILKIK